MTSSIEYIWEKFQGKKFLLMYNIAYISWDAFFKNKNVRRVGFQAEVVQKNTDV